MVVAFYSYRSTLKNMPWELIMSNKNYQKQCPNTAANQ